MLPTTSTRAAREKKKEQQTASVAKKIKKTKDQAPEVEEMITQDITEADPVEESQVESPPKVEVPRGGLAAALAKSQAVKQELLKTPRQLAQERAGVKKI